MARLVIVLPSRLTLDDDIQSTPLEMQPIETSIFVAFQGGLQLEGGVARTTFKAKFNSDLYLPPIFLNI